MRKRRFRWDRLLLVICVIALLSLTSLYLYTEYIYNPLKDVVKLEAGTTTLNYEDFLSEKVDATATLKKGLTKQQSQKVGKHQVIFTIDKKDYVSHVQIEDHEPPVIKGATDRRIKLGESVLYKKGITLEDNASGDIKLEIDNSKVNTEVAGVYPVIYKATDASGNVSTKEVKFTFYEYSDALRQHDEALNHARRIVASVSKETDTKEQKLYKAFMWCRKIPYGSQRKWRNTKNYPAVNAMDFFVRNRGDCHGGACAVAYLALAIGYDEVYLKQDNHNEHHEWCVINGRVYDPLFSKESYKGRGMKNCFNGLEKNYCFQDIGLVRKLTINEI